MKVSYAQNFEDVMLWRAVGHVAAGFYIDIGAQDPLIDSVSRTFYESGWRGVHVEPTPAYAHALRQARPDEAVLQTAVGSGGALMPFFEIPGSGISTGDADLARRHGDAGYESRCIEVPCIRLSDLLDRYRDRDIHWMKIDVEGMESSVLDSWAPSAVRPWVLVVEAMVPMAQQLAHGEWEQTVLGLGYRYCYFDGLNRYYVADAHAELARAFDVPPNVFDDFTLSGTASHRLCKRLNQCLDEARGEVAQLQRRLATPDPATQAQVADLQRRVAERTRQSEQGLHEAMAQSRQVAATLAHLEGARAETLQLLKALVASDRAQVVRADAARDEVARLQRCLAERELALQTLQSDSAARLAQAEAALHEAAAERRRRDAAAARREAELQAERSALEAAFEQRLAEHAAARASDARAGEQRLAERQQALDAAAWQLQALQAGLDSARAAEARLRGDLAQQLGTADQALQTLGRSRVGRVLRVFGWTPPSLPSLPSADALPTGPSEHPPL